ncbi:MAG: glycosyltransferase family 4 protein [Acidobacteriota bacterium]
MAAQRVCVVAPRVPFLRGGAELLDEQLAAALAGEGYEVETITIPYVWSPTRLALQQALAWRLLNLTAEALGKGVKVDLVIATKFPSYLVRHPNKVVWTIHQQRELYDLHGSEFGPLSISEEDRSLRQAIIDIDQQALSESRALFSISENISRRLWQYSGFKAQTLYPPPKLYDALRSGPYDDYLLYIGRLDPLKRIDLTLRALRATESPVRLLIAGRGPHRAELERLATDLGLSDRVQFLGYVSDDDVVGLYAGCFAVILTPLDEDYGFTTLESFLAGKPVVTTSDAGGVLEFVEDGACGFVVAPEAEIIAERIDTLYRDRALCETLGMEGRARVRQRVSWKTVIKALTGTLE